MQPWGGVAGKRVLISGATSGIGLAAAVELARRGAQLVMIARSETKANEAVRRIRAAAGDAAVVDTLLADLASQSSIREVAAKSPGRNPTSWGWSTNAGPASAVSGWSPARIDRPWGATILPPSLLA